MRPSHIALDELVERQNIADVVTLLFVRTDERDWPAVRACFADRVFFDMTSLTGGTGDMVDADDIVAGWAKGLEPLAAVHHQVGNLLIDVRGEYRSHRGRAGLFIAALLASPLAAQTPCVMISAARGPNPRQRSRTAMASGSSKQSRGRTISAHISSDMTAAPLASRSGLEPLIRSFCNSARP